MAPKLLSFLSFSDDRGTLTAYETPTQVPFQIRRIFYVNGRENETRGRHAHYECQQLLICLCGKITVRVKTAETVTLYELEDSSQGLLLPKLTWAEQFYHTNDSRLMVMCDLPYDTGDYIHDFDLFKKLTK